MLNNFRTTVINLSIVNTLFVKAISCATQYIGIKAGTLLPINKLVY